MKICSICKQAKSDLDFYAKQSACKECCKQRQRQYNKQNRDYINTRQAKYNQEHKIEAKVYREQNKDLLNKKSKEYYSKHKDKILAQKASKKKQKALYDRKYYYTIRAPVRPVYKNLTPSQRYHENQLSNCFSSGIRQALKANKAGKHWEDLVPYNLQQLKEHLESQFDENMNWSNMGKYWEIDHIIPQNLFNVTTADSRDFQICWSLMNLRPLKISENRSRPKNGSDIPEELKQKILGQTIKSVIM